MKISPFTGVMLDMETLAVAGAPAILSIGAVRFRWEDGRCSEVDRLYANIQKRDWNLPGLVVDGDTLGWWFHPDRTWQRAALESSPVTLAMALSDLAMFCWPQMTDGPPLELWANGADWQWLQSVYAALRLDFPHDFRQTRDLRTLRKLCGVSAGPTKHHALMDARAQVLTLEACLRVLGAKDAT